MQIVDRDVHRLVGLQGKVGDDRPQAEVRAVLSGDQRAVLPELAEAGVYRYRNVKQVPAVRVP